MYRHRHLQRDVSLVPENIVGCILHLDGFRGLNLSDGAAVATWADQSPAGNHATQATGSKQPLFNLAGMNGFPAVLFDGIDDWISSDSVGVSLAGNNIPFTVTILWKFNSVATVPAMWNITNPALAVPLNAVRLGGGGNVNLLFGYTPDSGVTGGSVSVDIRGHQLLPKIYTFIFDGSQVSAWRNGQAIGFGSPSGGQSTSNAFTIAAQRTSGTITRPAPATMGGISVFKRALSDIERCSVEKYYSTRFNIPTLP